MNKRPIAITLGIAVLCALTLMPKLPRQCEAIVCVWVFDIGQGDAIYIDGQDYDLVIDGGPTDMVVEKIGAILYPWDTSIDATLMTHPDADHMNGLAHLLGRYRILNVFDSLQAGSSAEYAAYEELSGPRRQGLHAGDRLELGGGAYLEIVYPEQTFDRNKLSDPNGASIIAILHVGDQAMLLTGDAGVEQEREIVNSLPDIDVLKVGHHGSRTSTSAELLEAAKPEIAIIPAGKDNDYGHPHPDVVDRLLEYGVTVYQTNLHGDIRIDFGQEITVKRFSL
ncbi:MBL fold metallo-hydrolase [Patescibacteria group bacterium]|nr:MBL fold metallo-hydrolase [Patescibacteria group bacterium]